MPQGQHARHGLECLGAGAGVQRGLPVGARQYLAAWNRSASARAGSSKARRRWCVSNASRSSASAAPDDSKQSISASIAGPNRCARAFFLELGASLLTRARPRASSSHSLISNSSTTRRRRRRHSATWARSVVDRPRRDTAGGPFLVASADSQQEMSPVTRMVLTTASAARRTALGIAFVQGSGVQFADRGHLLYDLLAGLLRGRASGVASATTSLYCPRIKNEADKAQ